MHGVQLAGSGNGWIRPEQDEAEIALQDFNAELNVRNQQIQSLLDRYVDTEVAREFLLSPPDYAPLQDLLEIVPNSRWGDLAGAVVGLCGRGHILHVLELQVRRSAFFLFHFLF